MKCDDWASIRVNRQYRKKSKRVILKSVQGFDTETDIKTGNIYLMCSSSGRYMFNKSGFTLTELLEFLCYKDNRYTLNTFFNLRFDSSAVLKQLPKQKLKELWILNETEYEDYRIKLIPKKYLSITHCKSGYSYYDISQFYNTSLDYAARRFLGKHKIQIDLHDNNSADKLIDYCLRDAELCAELTDYLINQYDSSGLKVNKLYSTAYISQKYFSKYCDIPAFDKCRWGEYAFNSYHGGRFEVFKRGYIDEIYYYDINSAYPYEISQLIDLRRGYWEFKKEYDEDCYYAFVKCKLKTGDGISIIPYMKKGANIYPHGDYGVIYLSKNEYDYLIAHGHEIEFIDGYFFKPVMIEYPFEILEKIYRIRQDLKKENNPLEHNYKIILNSLYGKFIQMIPKSKITIDNNDFDGILDEDELTLFKKSFETGNLFNPVYAALITANTRLKLIERLPSLNNIVGFATDSILSQSPLDLAVSGKLGDWKLELKAPGIIIGSGVYVIEGDKRIERFRGFGNTEKYNLSDSIKKNGNNNSITISVERPVSMGEAIKHINRYTIDDICRFKTVDKILNINFDTKRIWERNFIDCNDMSKNCIESEIIGLT